MYNFTLSQSPLNAGEALGKRIINTRSLHLDKSAFESIITNNRSLHFNEFGVRMHYTVFNLDEQYFRLNEIVQIAKKLNTQ